MCVCVCVCVCARARARAPSTYLVFHLFNPLEYHSPLGSCVKVEVAVLGSPSIIVVLMVSVFGRKATLNLNKTWHNVGVARSSVCETSPEGPLRSQLLADG